MIDIIIPAYNAHSTIKDTLYSIAYQTIKEKVKVYICNDDPKQNYDEIINQFSRLLNIKELKMPCNGGPGLARQCGIDNSNSEYIVFIDSDDTFSDCFALELLYDFIEENKSDIVSSVFVEQTNNDFIEKANDFIWLHGKIYRRSFIEKNNIKFNDTRANEDNGFNQLLWLMGAKLDYFNHKTYIWEYNENSITRKNNHEYRFSGLYGYIYNMVWAIKKALEKKGNQERIKNLIYSALTASYYYYLEYYDIKEYERVTKEATELKKISQLYPIDEEELCDILASQFEYALQNGSDRKKLLNPIVSFDNYINNIL